MLIYSPMIKLIMSHQAMADFASAQQNTWLIQQIINISNNLSNSLVIIEHFHDIV